VIQFSPLYSVLLCELNASDLVQLQGTKRAKTVTRQSEGAHCRPKTIDQHHQLLASMPWQEHITAGKESANTSHWCATYAGFDHLNRTPVQSSDVWSTLWVLLHLQVLDLYVLLPFVAVRAVVLILHGLLLVLINW